MGVLLKMVSTPKPNGFADHYPVLKNGYFIGNINPTFSDKTTKNDGVEFYQRCFYQLMMVFWVFDQHHLGFLKQQNGPSHLFPVKFAVCQLE